MQVTYISSQKYRDEDTVNQKRAASDYVVTVSPTFEINGDLYAVVIDGHHSHEAAKIDGVAPEYREANTQDSDRIQILLDGDVDGFLEAEYLGDAWYDINAGYTVF